MARSVLGARSRAFRRADAYVVLIEVTGHATSSLALVGRV
jgi:hypothetical protein